MHISNAFYILIVLCNYCIKVYQTHLRMYCFETGPKEINRFTYKCDFHQIVEELH